MIVHGVISIVSESESDRLERLKRQLIFSAALWNWSALDASSLPDAGIYAWFFRRIPDGIPTGGCISRDGATLLYVGISPRKEGGKGKLSERVRYHFEGKAQWSTLRYSLGSVLKNELGTVLKASGRSWTFGTTEAALSRWIAENAMVSWVGLRNPRPLEKYILNTISLPLNIEGNSHHPFCKRLKELRKSSTEPPAVR